MYDLDMVLEAYINDDINVDETLELLEEYDELLDDKFMEGAVKNSVYKAVDMSKAMNRQISKNPKFKTAKNLKTGSRVAGGVAVAGGVGIVKINHDIKKINKKIEDISARLDNTENPIVKKKLNEEVNNLLDKHDKLDALKKKIKAGSFVAAAGAGALSGASDLNYMKKMNGKDLNDVFKYSNRKAKFKKSLKKV